MKHRVRNLAVAVFTVLLLQGCIIVDRDAHGPQRSDSMGTTFGEELKDLDEAYEEGRLSQQEYQRLRNRILDY
tara:strand:+ start:625 stop:843 length:219 start_codon:yes stop_codon:yes gene_type:complete